MGAPRALMGLCRGPTLDTQLLKAAVAAEQGLPLHNSVGLTALHCLCENEAVTAAALEAVLPCGPRDLALARDRCATSPLDLLCRNGAVSVAMLEVVLSWCGPELIADRFLAHCESIPSAIEAADEDGWTPLHYLCRRPGASADLVRALVAAAPGAAAAVDDEGMAPLHYLCWNERGARSSISIARRGAGRRGPADAEGATPARYLAKTPSLCSFDLLKRRARAFGDAKVDARLVELKDAAAAARVAELRDRVAATADAHAAAWRALAKQQLDRGERAECLRLFAEGAARCPGNFALAHRGATFALFAEETADRVASGPFRRRGPGRKRRRADRSPDYGGDALAVYRGAVADAGACRRLGDAVEAAATAAWLERRCAGATDHAVYDAPATDLPEPAGYVRALVASLAARATLLFPGTFAGAPARVLDCFFVRYDAERCFAEMRDHVDESAVSLSVALNDAGDYDGGGLHVAAAGNVLDGPAGSVFCFLARSRTAAQR
ncbi:procollagen-lysine 5-dioxygenase [Aureococcus anophagefferens]|nr:procollagen-lysine 5-dioxygenase [Aureococcus anophagefferens]